MADLASDANQAEKEKQQRKIFKKIGYQPQKGKPVPQEIFQMLYHIQ